MPYSSFACSYTHVLKFTIERGKNVMELEGELQNLLMTNGALTNSGKTSSVLFFVVVVRSLQFRRLRMDSTFSIVCSCCNRTN